MGRNTIFVSYSRTDANVCEELVEQLRFVVGMQPDLELFVDKGIRTGDEWRKEIDAALEKTVVAVFLISASFLNSDFVRTVEIPCVEAARREGLAKIACLYVRPAAGVQRAQIPFELPDGTRATVRLADFQGINEPSCPLSGLDGHARETLLARAAEEVLDLATAMIEARAAQAAAKPDPARGKQPRSEESGAVGHGVFIAHAASDRQAANEVCAALEAAGIRCWIAPRDVGPGSWAANIAAAISECRLLVLVLSSHANKSRQVVKELNLADDDGLTIVPVRIEDVKPAAALRYYVSAQHWIDALPGARDEGIEELVRKVSAEFLRDPTPNELEMAMIEARDVPPASKPDPVRKSQPRSKGSGAGRIVRVEKAGIELVEIPGGTFWMGSADDDPLGYGQERPRHEVHVKPFLLATTPVTNEQYGRFLEATGHREPEYWTNSKFNDPSRPVVGVSWDDAVAFCQWAGLRLPTEAEWEFACRAGTDSRYWSGNEESDLDRVGWYDKNSGGSTRPVSQKPANPWGLFDMHGNVEEWCEDKWLADYKGAPSDGSAWLGGGGLRVVRGGSWDYAARYCRSAYRYWRRPGLRLSFVGFRPARFVTE